MISREVSRWGCGDGDSVQYAFLSGERRLYVHNGRPATAGARGASLGDRLGGLGRLGRRGGRVELVLLRRLRVVVLAEVRVEDRISDAGGNDAALAPYR